MSINRLSIFIGVLIVFPVFAKRDIDMQVACSCIVHDPSALQNVSCWTKTANRTTALTNIHGILVRQVDDAFVNIQMYKKTNSIYRPFLINTTKNYCDFFTKSRAGTYFQTIAPMYLPYTNMNHTCPYIGYVKGYTICWREDPNGLGSWPLSSGCFGFRKKGKPHNLSGLGKD